MSTPIHQTWADDLEEAYRWLATPGPPWAHRLAAVMWQLRKALAQLDES